MSECRLALPPSVSVTFTHSLTQQTLTVCHALSSGDSEGLTVQVKGCTGKAAAAAETKGSGGGSPAGGQVGALREAVQLQSWGHLCEVGHKQGGDRCC